MGVTYSSGPVLSLYTLPMLLNVKTQPWWW